VYSWKEGASQPVFIYRLNVTMTRDRIFSLKSALFSLGAEARKGLPSLPRSARENFDFSVAFDEFYLFSST
jgi:hypothetical protein